MSQPDEPLTPRAAAETEAARQAVMLAFGLAGAFIIMCLQRKMMREFMPGHQDQRMAEARTRERRWGTTAVWLWRLDMFRAARWAELKSVRARAEYEAMRP